MTSRPLRLDLHCAAIACRVMTIAAPWILLWAVDETPFDRIAMDVLNHLGEGFFAANVFVKVTNLPEPIERAFEATRCHLLEGLYKLCEKNPGRLVDEKMNVFGHQNVGIDSGIVSCAGLLQNGFH